MRTQDIGRNEVDVILQNALGGEPPREVERRLRGRLAAFRDRLASSEAPPMRTRRLVPRWAIPIPVAAALLVVALLAQPGGPAFAEVIAHVRAARTLTFRMTVQATSPTSEGQEVAFECMVMEPGRSRYAAPDGTIMVLDGRQGKGLTLNPHAKMALVISVKGRPSADNLGNEFLEDLRALQDSTAKSLGRREVDGHKVVGFHVSGTSGVGESEPPATVDWTIWADVQTGLPVRVEIETSVMGFEAHNVMSDFVFDPDLDESLFSLGVPAGYTLQQVDVDASEPSEADFLSALRQFAETTGGSFPARMMPAVSAADVSAQAGEIGAQIAANLARRGRQPNGAPSPEAIREAIKVGTGLQRAGAFVSALPPESQWHYSSQGVRLGDADKPLCWWRPVGSDTYRVVYGDLSVREVPEDALPGQ